MDQRIWHTRWVNRNRGAFGSILTVDSSLSSTGPRSLLTPVCSPIESLMPVPSIYYIGAPIDGSIFRNGHQIDLVDFATDRE